MRKLSATALMTVIVLGVGLAVFVYLIFLQPMRRIGIDSNLVAEDTATAPPIPALALYTRIAFVSDRDGNLEIYTMEPDGSDLMRLTVNNSPDLSPQWSPDGTQIAWLSEQDGQRDLYVMNYDGSNVIRLTETRDLEYAVRWSPDSRHIALAGEGGKAGAANLFLIPATGGESRLISDNMAGDFDWSPDGSQIAFVMPVGSTLSKALIVEKVETHEPIATLKRQIAGQIAWSPRNSTIAYIVNTSQVGYQATTIRLFDSQSGEQHDFVEAESSTNDLVWSPHGSFLAYVGWNEQLDAPQQKLYVVDEAGGSGEFLATMQQPMGIDWSPDEAQIVYASRRGDAQTGAYHLYVVERSQPDLEPESIIAGMSPDWSPVLSQRIANLPSLTPPPPTATPTPFPTLTPAPPGMQTRIVFYSTRDGNPEIYTMSPDGSDVIRLTHSKSGDIMPKWSPDGAHIAWLVWEEQEADIYAMNADGSNPIRLSYSTQYEYNFEWSPDGQWIAYTTVEDNHGQHLYIIPASGGESIPVTRNYVGEFHWSPDSRSLAFSIINLSLLVYDLATASTQSLVDGSERSGSFVWSPDGSQLAVSSVQNGPENGSVLRLIDPATGVQTTLLDSDKGISNLHWSPDGEYLAYVAMKWMPSIRDIEINMIPVRGGTPQHVTHFPYPSVTTVLPFTFDWSADSTQLVFSTEVDHWPNSTIMLVNRDGSGLREITDASSHNGMPDWSPYLPTQVTVPSTRSYVQDATRSTRR